MTPSSKVALCASLWLTAGVSLAEAGPAYVSHAGYAPRAAARPAGPVGYRPMGHARPPGWGHRPGPAWRPGPMAREFHAPAGPPGWGRVIVSSRTIPSWGSHHRRQPSRWGHARPYGGPAFHGNDGYGRGWSRASLLSGATSGAVYGGPYVEAPLTWSRGEPPLAPAPSWGYVQSYGYSAPWPAPAPRIIQLSATPAAPSNVRVVYGTNALYGYGARPAVESCDCAAPRRHGKRLWRAPRGASGY